MTTIRGQSLADAQVVLELVRDCAVWPPREVAQRPTAAAPCTRRRSPSAPSSSAPAAVNQTSLQAIASAGSPLLRPLPLFSVFEVLAERDPYTLGAWGSFKDIGNYDLCVRDGAASHHCTIQAFGGPTLGLCLPRACAVRDYLHLYQCEEKLLFDSLNATSALVPALVSATAALEAVSRALDYLAVRTTSFCAEDARYEIKPGSAAVLALTAVLFGLVLVSSAVCAGAQHAPPAWAVHFDAVGNLRRLRATRPVRGELAFLDGVRCLSTGYVELGHQFLVAAFSAKNAVPAAADYLRSFESTLILGAFSAVDSFFWISGLLAARSLLELADARAAGEPSTPLRASRVLGQSALALVHRYLRLTPLYAYVLFAYSQVLPLVGSGPLWVMSQQGGGLGDKDACARTWWTNLLYLNNLVGEEGRVGTAGYMGWSWYLAVDMQCFTVAALVLPWYGRAPRAVVGFLVAQVALSVVTSAALSSAYQAGITTLDPAYSKHIYPMPYTRCGAYAIGSLLGVLLHERGRAARGARAALPADARAVEEAAPARRAGWWAAGCLILPLVFLLPWADLRDGGLFEPARQHWAQWQRDAYTGAQRPLWAAGLSALALCLIDGRRPASTMRRLAAPLDALLSHPAWEVLGKLSYGAYLWHLVVILALYYSALDFQTFSRVDVAIGYVAVLLASFALTLCSYLLVEKPAMNLEGALLGALLGAPPSKRQRAPARAANPALAQALLDPVAHADAASGSHPAHTDADAACLPSASSTGLRWRPTTSDEAANAEPAAAVAVTVTGFT